MGTFRAEHPKFRAALEAAGFVMLKGRVQAPEGLTYRQGRRLWQKVMRATASWYVVQCQSFCCRKIFCSGFNGKDGIIEGEENLSMIRLDFGPGNCI